MADSQACLIKFISNLQEQQYFGKVTLCFQNGQIKNIKTERTLKFSDLETMNFSKSSGCKQVVEVLTDG